jgi:hypothetical protein
MAFDRVILDAILMFLLCFFKNNVAFKIIIRLIIDQNISNDNFKSRIIFKHKKNNRIGQFLKQEMNAHSDGWFDMPRPGGSTKLSSQLTAWYRLQAAKISSKRMKRDY